MKLPGVLLRKIFIALMFLDLVVVGTLLILHDAGPAEANLHYAAVQESTANQENKESPLSFDLKECDTGVVLSSSGETCQLKEKTLYIDLPVVYDELPIIELTQFPKQSDLIRKGYSFGALTNIKLSIWDKNGREYADIYDSEIINKESTSIVNLIPDAEKSEFMPDYPLKIRLEYTRPYNLFSENLSNRLPAIKLELKTKNSLHS